jgi:uncharacterized membrane protein
MRRRVKVTPVMVAVGVVVIAAALSLAIDRNDIMAMYRHRGIRPAHPPYTDRFLEYPVVVGLLAWTMSFVAHSAPQMLATYCVLAAVLLAVIVRVLAVRGELDRRWLPALPAFVFYSVHNYDLVAVVCVVGGVIAFESGSFVVAGGLLALSTWTKLYAALIVFGLGVWLWRAQRRSDLVRFGAAFVAVSAALNLPVLLQSTDGWLATFRFHVKRIPNWGSLWFYLIHDVHRELTFARATSVRIVNSISTTLVVVGTAALAVWIWRRRPDPRAIACAATIVFVLANKVFSPQYDLWLVPLMILAGTPLPLVRSFVVVDAAVFADVFLVPIHWADAADVRTAVMFALVIARALVLLRVLGQTGRLRVAGGAARLDDRSEGGLGFLDRT